MPQLLGQAPDYLLPALHQKGEFLFCNEVDSAANPPVTRDTMHHFSERRQQQTDNSIVILTAAAILIISSIVCITIVPFLLI